MKKTNSYYLVKIKEELSLKQRQNPNYSLRAYARDIGVHPSTLSQIINGKRPLPLKDSAMVVERLNLGPKEKTLFMESLLKTKMSLDKIQVDSWDDHFMLDESYHRVIAEWEHYAILELFHIENFNPTIDEVIYRLGITENRAEVVIQNLLVSGLLKEEAGRLIKTHHDVRTTEDVKSQALRESHREAMEMGKQKLDEIEVELRDFSSATVAVNLTKLPEAKAIIREFRQKMEKLLRDDQTSEVFQLAIQFYPLTKIQKQGNE